MSVVPKKKKKTALWKKLAVTGIIAVILYTIGGFFIAPMIIKSQAEKIITTETGLKADLTKVSVNPYALTLTVEGFKAGPENEPAWFSLARLHADLQMSSLFGPDFVLKEVSLEKPEILIRMENGGSINLLTLAKKFQTTTNSEPISLPPALINHLSISNAIVRWEDNYLAPGFTSELRDIDLTFTNFHDLRTNAFELNALLAPDTVIGVSGDVSLIPLKARISAGLENLVLERFVDYVPDWLPFQLTGGNVNSRINISADLTDMPPDIRISDGETEVKSLSFRTADSDLPVLELGTVKLEGANASLIDQSVSLDVASVADVQLEIRRSAEGTLNWQTWVEQVLANIPESETAPSEPLKPWNWSVGQFSASNANINITDYSVKGPVELSVKNASASVSNLGPDMSQPLPIELGFELESGGSGTISGNVTPVPLSAEVNLAVNEIYFPIGQPYVQDVLRLKLKDGKVSVNGDAKLSLNETSALTAFYAGDIRVNDVEVHEETDSPFATVGEVKIDDLEIDWPLDDFKVKSVFVNKPVAHLYLREDGTANVEEIVPASITEQIYQQLNEAWKLLQFEVGELTVTNGFVGLTDHSISPRYEKQITNIFLNLVGLKPNAEEPAKVNIAGKIMPSGPFSVVGEFTTASTDIVAKVAVNAQMIHLSPQSPYAGKFLGHLIDSGDVSVDLRYELNGVLVKGENRVIVNAFEFGESTDSEDAVSLPVKLGVSLLKDADGKIDLDVPVEGDIRDPEFKLSKVIWSTFSNIFKKAVTAPFKFLGKLVGAGDDEDLGSIVFAAGQSELTDDEKKKARKLSQALNERPALRLEIVGKFDPANDAAQLKNAQLEKTLADLNSRLATDEELMLLARAFPDPAKLDRDELIQLLFVRTYGVNYDTPAKPPSDLIARRALEQRTQSKVEEESQLIAETSATSAAAKGTFWAKTKDVLTLKPLTGGDKSEDAIAETAVEVATPEKSKTAEIIIIDEPIPVLPPLPSVAEMEAKLVAEQIIDDTILAELATERAEAVRIFFTSEAGIDDTRLQIATELSGPEPATAEAKVFLGIY